MKTTLSISITFDHDGIPEEPIENIHVLHEGIDVTKNVMNHGCLGNTIGKCSGSMPWHHLEIMIYELLNLEHERKCSGCGDCQP